MLVAEKLQAWVPREPKEEHVNFEYGLQTLF